jgi:hypothetical protein
VSRLLDLQLDVRNEARAVGACLEAQRKHRGEMGSLTRGRNPDADP